MPSAPHAAALSPKQPVATEAGMAPLWQRLRESGDAQTRRELIEHYLPYARIVAATYYARRMHDEIEFSDYLQLACRGLMESVDRYDPALGAQFTTFAARRMHGAILDGLERLTEKQQQISARKRLRQDRLQAAKALASEGKGSVMAGGRRAAGNDELFRYLAEVSIGLALGILLEGTGMIEQDSLGNASEPDQHYRQYELAQLRQQMRELVGRLPEQQRTVVKYHYLQEHSFTEIAEQLGLTKGRISQIHTQALASLRNLLAKRNPINVAF